MGTESTSFAQKAREISRVASIAVLSFFLALSYQNCGQSQYRMEDLELSSLLDYFAYGYESEPAFYADFAVYRQSTADSRNVSYKFVGAAAYVPDSSKTVSYSVTLTDSSGHPVCASESGTTSAIDTTIVFDCVTPSLHDVRVTLLVATNGQSYSTSKIYK